MKNNRRRFHSLSRRIILQFCLFTLFLSALYTLFIFLLMYTLEDSFIERDVLKEAQYFEQAYLKTGAWPKSRKSYMALHFSKASFPQDIRALAIEEPNRREFYGSNGRHYHVYTLPNFPDTFLVAEVSEELLVRPIKDGLIKFLVISGLVLTLFACSMAWWLSRRTIKPLKQLSDLVDGVELQQLPDTFATDYPNNEIGILAEVLEQSMTRIGQAMERERCFTRDVSHELRTPLAIIKNATEVLNSQSDLKPRHKEVMVRIADASMQMEQTVNTLLVLAREEYAKSASEPTDLMAIVEQSVINNSYILAGKDVEVDIDDSCQTLLNTQTGMLKVLVDNLITNAFQYTEKGEVSLQFKDGELLVRDTGEGIAEDISDKLMEPAVKGQKSKGFGFGMSIVKRLCDHQGWQISVESNQALKGTLVRVKIS